MFADEAVWLDVNDMTSDDTIQREPFIRREHVKRATHTECGIVLALAMRLMCGFYFIGIFFVIFLVEVGVLFHIF